MTILVLRPYSKPEKANAFIPDGLNTLVFQSDKINLSLLT